jgi:hypothetical protein
MKKFLLFLAFFFMIVLPWCCSRAQDLQVQYINYTDGHYTIAINNPKTCDADVRINWMKGGLVKDTIIPIAQNTIGEIIHLPANFSGGSLIKIKSDGQCSSNGWISLTVPGLVPLPVQLQTFYASLTGRYIFIKWSTAVEQDLSYYDVQRSADGRFFSSLEKTNASGSEKYSVLDLRPLTGFNYYRLKMVDNDGKFAYSSIVRIQFLNDIQFYEVFTIDGRLMARSSTRDQAMTALLRGNYLLKENYASGSFNTRMLVIN